MAHSGKTILTYLILVLAGISSGTGVYGEDLTFLTYNDTKEGFSVSYPEGASLLYAADADMSEMSVLTPDNITMIRITVRDTGESLENLTESMLISPLFLTNGTIQEKGGTRLGGADAFFIDYQWTRSGVPVRSYSVTTVKDGKQYSVSYDNRAEDYKENKILIDKLIDSFTFSARENTDKYNTGFSYYPGTVYDYFGIPMTDPGQESWNPYAYYGWDGSTGYSYPSPNYNQFPLYTGYDPNNQIYQQYPQPIMMPTMMPTMAYTTTPTVRPTPRPTGQQVSGEEIETLIEDGFDFLAKNQYKQAESKFKAAIQMDATDFRAHYGYAKVLYIGYEGKEEEALKEVTLANTLGSQSATELQLAMHYALKAEIERYLKKYEDALESIEYAIAHGDEKDLAYNYYQKAKILYFGNKPFDQVIDAAEQAVSLDPSDEKYKDFLKKVKTEAGSGSSGNSVYPAVTPSHTGENTSGEITYAGGDGSSLKEAIIIKGAESEMEGLDAENNWISDAYGNRNTDWKIDKITLISEEGRNYDKYEIVLSDYSPVTIWFDITGFH